MIRVAVVDDHRLFRKGLIALIKTFEGIDVVLDANNGQELFDLLPGREVDVVLLDIQMPVMDGFETCKLLREKHPDIKVLMLSQFTTAESVQKIMEMGAHGFFTKDSDPEQIGDAIRSVKDKDFYFGRELGSVIKEALNWENAKAVISSKPASVLSKREIEIVALACKELSSAEIADKLFIHLRTVESHRGHIMDKVGAKNFIGVVLYALKNNLIDLGDF